jgi:hypothetical protein
MNAPDPTPLSAWALANPPLALAGAIVLFGLLVAVVVLARGDR